MISDRAISLSRSFTVRIFRISISILWLLYKTFLIFIKKGKSLKKVLLSDIIYIEVEEKYCNIITEKEKFVILISLTKILNLLDDNAFCRTHRNFIANIDKIVEIVPSDNLIVLQGNHHVTLSERYKDIIKKVRTLK